MFHCATLTQITTHIDDQSLSLAPKVSKVKICKFKKVVSLWDILCKKMLDRREMLFGW